MNFLQIPFDNKLVSNQNRRIPMDLAVRCSVPITTATVKQFFGLTQKNETKKIATLPPEAQELAQMLKDPADGRPRDYLSGTLIKDWQKRVFGEKEVVATGEILVKDTMDGRAATATIPGTLLSSTAAAGLIAGEARIPAMLVLAAGSWLSINRVTQTVEEKCTNAVIAATIRNPNLVSVMR
jgi:hypothetical protein